MYQRKTKESRIKTILISKVIQGKSNIIQSYPREIKHIKRKQVRVLEVAEKKF